jgi:hypothetical protein
MFKKLNDPKVGKGGEAQKLGKSLVDLQTPPLLLDVLSSINQFTEMNGLETQLGEVEVEVILFAKGLTLDRAIYREYATPEGQRVLEDVLQGRVPPDLMIRSKGQPLSLLISDRRGEDFIPERLRPRDQGQVGKVDLSVDFKYDETQPTTTLQVRFHTDHDLKKIVVNMSTKVQELHDYIMACAPVAEDYMLMCGYPPQPLEDPDMTVEMLHLLNGTVIQQMLL